jgi:hypothetical protein
MAAGWRTADCKMHDAGCWVGAGGCTRQRPAQAAAASCQDAALHRWTDAASDGWGDRCAHAPERQPIIGCARCHAEAAGASHSMRHLESGRVCATRHALVGLARHFLHLATVRSRYGYRRRGARHAAAVQCEVHHRGRKLRQLYQHADHGREETDETYWRSSDRVRAVHSSSSSSTGRSCGRGRPDALLPVAAVAHAAGA